MPALAAGVIRHHAEPVALVAAPDKATLRAARRRIRLRTEPLEPVLDPLASSQQFAAYEISRGDLEGGFAAAALVVEGEYRVGHQEQLYIENQAMIAEPRPDGGITITGSMQCPYYVHEALKRALALSDTQAVITQAETGGGFGGKEEYPSVLAIHAALLAQRVGRPVRMIYDRHEDISATTKRHPAIVRHRTGVDADGRLVAQDIEVVMDGGAYCTLTPVVLSRGVLHAGGPYECPNVRIRGRAMATNTPPNGAFRGFGAPQVEFAAELQVARVADQLGISPAVLRERWLYREGGITPTGQVLRESVGAAEVLERAVEAAEYERVRELSQQTRAIRWAQAAEAGRGVRSTRIHAAPGIGIALAWHGAGFTGRGEVHLASVAGVELGDDGVIRVLIANTEIGQGTKTIFPMLAAEALGIDPGEVEMAPVDTSIVPDSGPTVASRTAMIVGGLVIRAAQRLRATVEARSGAPFAATYRADAQANGATRIDQRFEPYPRCRLRRRDLPGRRLPGLRLGLRRGSRGRGPRQRPGPRPQRRLGRRRRPRHPPRPGGGPGRGRHAAGRRLRHHRGDEAGPGPLPERPPLHVPHPDVDGCPEHHRHPRGEALQRRAARRQGGRRAAHGRRRAGHRRCHPRRRGRLDHAAAGDPGARAGRHWRRWTGTRRAARDGRPRARRQR